jgi:hypothetical protein
MPKKKDITYGGSSDELKICPKCNQPITDHHLGGKVKIRPTDETTRLARSLQSIFDVVFDASQTQLRAKRDLEETQREERLAKESTMIGVAIATYQNSKGDEEIIKFGTASGILGAEMLQLINQKDNSIKNLKLINIQSAGTYNQEEISHTDGVSTFKHRFQMYQNNVLKDKVLDPQKTFLFTVEKESREVVGRQAIENTRNRTSIGNQKLGSCAAQKLFQAIFEYAWKNKKRVTNIDMSEIFWQLSKSNKSQEYKAGELCESCDTCKKVLPQILCDLKNE